MSLFPRSSGLLLFAVLYSIGAFAITAQTRAEGLGNLPTVALHETRSFDQVLADLAQKRVICVGETHTRFDHHLIQLHVLQSMVATGKPVAIGVEWFQQPFQPVLDRYIAGEIGETELLRQSEYFLRWRYDFRLYAPILRFARAHRIPVIALNLPSELTREVGDRGIEQLDERLRKWLPRTLDRSNVRYQQRLRAIFDAHPQNEFSDFERFYTVQLLWDEGMAERAARFLRDHPDTQLLIFAGSGHLAYGDGIPTRLERQAGVDATILLSQWEPGMQSGLADYLLLSPPQDLPAAGMLGVTIEPGADGGVRLRSVESDSAAAQAGARQGDLLVALNGTAIRQLADVRAVMWEKAPGDHITMTVQRHSELQGETRQQLAVTLQ